MLSKRLAGGTRRLCGGVTDLAFANVEGGCRVQLPVRLRQNAALRMKLAFPFRRDEIDKGGQRRRHESAGEIEARPVKGNPPFRQNRQNPHEIAGRQMRIEPVFVCMGQSMPGPGPIERGSSGILSSRPLYRQMTCLRSKKSTGSGWRHQPFSRQPRCTDGGAVCRSRGNSCQPSVETVTAFQVSSSCCRRTILSETSLRASLPSKSCGGGVSDAISVKTASASFAGSPSCLPLFS